MIETLEDFRRKFARRAILMEIGGFRPSNDPKASYFGRVNFSAKEEGWPTQSGIPMHALAQINLLELPFRLPCLEDIDFITIFIGPDNLPKPGEQNGQNWELRAYKDFRSLAPIESLETNSHIKPFQMHPKEILYDYPCRENLPIEVVKELNISFGVSPFINSQGFKLGGWPFLLQSEISWGSENEERYKPEYVFQIDSSEKANWTWGDKGVGYFGRGTVQGNEDVWCMEWQCL